MKKNELRLNIIGVPVAKQSFRYASGKKNYRPKNIDDAMKDIQWQVRAQLPKGFKLFRGPLFIIAVFVFPPLKNHTKAERQLIAAGGLVKKYTKPDKDNLEKGLYDALEGVVYRNDSQVFSSLPYKGYGKHAGTHILIREYGKLEPFIVNVFSFFNEGAYFNEIHGGIS